MIFKDFEIIVTSRCDYEALYCEISIDQKIIAEVYNDQNSGKRIVNYDTGKTIVSLDEFSAIIDFCAYYLMKRIPISYLEKYLEKKNKSKKFVFELYDSAMSASILYIASLNKDNFEFSDDFIDLENLFNRMVELMDSRKLEIIPEDVISELLHEIDNADFPITDEQRAILEKYASTSPGPSPGP